MSEHSLPVSLSRLFPAVKAREPLWKHTSFRIGGPADFYAEVRSLADLSNLVTWSHKNRKGCFVLGRGSNLLVQDGGVRGVVIRLAGDFETADWNGPLVRTGAGAPLPVLARLAAARSLSGLEPLVGVPGTVGGALISNAGTPRGEIGPLVERVDFVDMEGRPRCMERGELEFGYRRSNLEGFGVITGALLRLKPDDRNVIIRRIQDELAWRGKTQPTGTHNVGSVFRNPPGDFAGRLIEAAGLKGERRGDAQFSRKHANFIVNLGRAFAVDVLCLIENARTAVRDRFGIDLELEIKVVGEPP